jgi:hypothetical protein
MYAPEAEGPFRRRRGSSRKNNTPQPQALAAAAAASVKSIHHTRTKTTTVLALCALVILLIFQYYQSSKNLSSITHNNNTVAVKPVVVGSNGENIGGIRVQKKMIDEASEGKLSKLLTSLFAQTNTNNKTSPSPKVKGEKVYSHDNKKLVDVAECTKDQLQSISSQLQLDGNVAIGIETCCPNPTWITNFYKEEKDIGSSTFLSVNIGCNKGHDAIRAARMGMSNAEFDVNEWNNAVGIGRFVCGSGDGDQQPEIVFPSRPGEMHW